MESRPGCDLVRLHLQPPSTRPSKPHRLSEPALPERGDRPANAKKISAPRKPGGLRTSLPFTSPATDGGRVSRHPGVTPGALAQPGRGGAGGHLFRVLNRAPAVTPPPPPPTASWPVPRARSAWHPGASPATRAALGLRVGRRASSFDSPRSALVFACKCGFEGAGLHPGTAVRADRGLTTKVGLGSRDRPWGSFSI
ncbi:hypothetical protein SKAU_G00304490 [Synaphobranchus kaupii]|uniref:Uncharacterized protein n=1 Tax=Synaphobranchus kaupii TaxID=118154 RepID=A0A9Q1INM4_SYNKA|nr:hypothetical protein SKAU_G00304490 [Synaphobranchus kaupii]